MALITRNPDLAAGYAGRTARLIDSKIASDTAQAGPYGSVAEPLTRRPRSATPAASRLQQ